jgi:soluble lytic murein transglycosylase-like protein
MRILLLTIIYSSLTLASPFPPEEPTPPTCNIAYYVQKGPYKHPKPVALHIAKTINSEALKRDLDPYLVSAIISVESDFRFIEVNHTGDYGLTQINYNIWSKEFNRLGIKKLSKQRLVTDPVYAIKTMTQILEIVKNRFSNDPLWYARYHSSTPFLKKNYAKKVKKRLQSIKTFASINTTKCTNQGELNGTFIVSITR